MAVIEMFPSAPRLDDAEREATAEMLQALTDYLGRGELSAVAVCALVGGDHVYTGGVGVQNDPYRLIGLLDSLKAQVREAVED